MSNPLLISSICLMVEVLCLLLSTRLGLRRSQLASSIGCVLVAFSLVLMASIYPMQSVSEAFSDAVASDDSPSDRELWDRWRSRCAGRDELETGRHTYHMPDGGKGLIHMDYDDLDPDYDAGLYGDIPTYLKTIIPDGGKTVTIRMVVDCKAVREAKR